MSGMFGSASHDEVLQLVFQVGVLLVAARALGTIARRLGQPSVVGEILAGVVLGPSLLSGIFPSIERLVMPQTAVQGHLLEVVGLIGVMLLMVVTGLETDLALIRSRIRVASGVAVGGLVVPFVSGIGLALVLPEFLVADPSRRPLFALFIATALSISAIPVLAKVLIEMRLMRQEIGQTMLAAGMIDDITGWTLLGLVTGLAGAAATNAGTIGMSALSVIGFVAATATVGRWAVRRSLDAAHGRLGGDQAVLTLVVGAAFLWGAFSQWLHLEPVLGAFAVGILFGSLPRLPASVVHTLETMALGVFAPVFFAVAGLKVDITAILSPRLLGLTLAVIAVASFGKVAGAYLGARLLSRQGHWQSLAYGAGLNARGALEIIVASIGLSLGILSRDMFSIIVVMAVTTSIMAPLALRAILPRIEISQDEERKLAKRDAINRTFTAGVLRMLIPVRPRPDVVGTQVIQARIARKLAETHSTSTTLLAVVTQETKEPAQAYLKMLRAHFDHRDTTTKVLVSDQPSPVIIDQSHRGYGMVMLGAPVMADTAHEGTLFGPLIDDIVRMAGCPSVVVRGEIADDGWAPRRILVPINGTKNSARALDLSLAISDPDSAILATHVVTPTLAGGGRALAIDIAAETVAIAADLERTVNTRIVEAPDVETGILDQAIAEDADLIVIGTSVRAGTARLHLGPRVEHIARYSPCPVVIVNG